jgi:hypothetical protein
MTSETDAVLAGASSEPAQCQNRLTAIRRNPSETIEERRTMADLSFRPLARSGTVAEVSFGA